MAEPLDIPVDLPIHRILPCLFDSIHSSTFAEYPLCTNCRGHAKSCLTLGEGVRGHSFWTQSSELFELFQIAGGG